MSFIGVVSEVQSFEILKKIIKDIENKTEITLINLNSDNIDNFKNVKFETILFLSNITIGFTNICKSIKYLIVNSDFEIKNKDFIDVKTHIISFGLNHKSTVTFSSITDENILISIQRSFENSHKKIVEVGEYNFKINEKDRQYLSEILAGFVLKKLYLET